MGSYNRSIKWMMKLPLATHRFMLEPLSGEKPAMIILADRFLTFMDKIDKTDKEAIKMLKREAMKDVRSTTGANYRGIMLMSGETTIKKVNRDSLKKVEVYKVKEEDLWKVKIAADLIDLREGIAELEGFNKEEMGVLLDSICVS